MLSCSSYSMSTVQGPRLQLHRDPCLRRWLRWILLHDYQTFSKGLIGSNLSITSFCAIAWLLWSSSSKALSTFSSTLRTFGCSKRVCFNSSCTALIPAELPRLTGVLLMMCHVISFDWYYPTSNTTKPKYGWNAAASWRSGWLKNYISSVKINCAAAGSLRINDLFFAVRLILGLRDLSRYEKK